MTIREHSRLLAGFFFIKGLLLVLFWVLSGGFFKGSLFMLLSAGFYMLTGWKIQNDLENAKIFGVVAAILCLPNFPLGTALGIYALWFFFMRSEEIV